MDKKKTADRQDMEKHGQKIERVKTGRDTRVGQEMDISWKVMDKR